MGGWFRKEINAVSDLNGLKMRMGGFAGRVLQKLGTVPQVIAGGEIYSALEKGTIDGAEWVGPYDDEKLGFYKVAKFYYYPGWWEGGTMIHNFVNLGRLGKAAEDVPVDHPVGVRIRQCRMQAKIRRRQSCRLEATDRGRHAAAGVPQPVMEACFKAANEVYDETSKANAEFKKLYEH